MNVGLSVNKWEQYLRFRSKTKSWALGPFLSEARIHAMHQQIVYFSSCRLCHRPPLTHEDSMIGRIDGRGHRALRSTSPSVDFCKCRRPRTDLRLGAHDPAGLGAWVCNQTWAHPQLPPGRYGPCHDYCSTLKGLHSGPGDPHFEPIFIWKLMILIYTSILGLSDSNSP